MIAKEGQELVDQLVAVGIRATMDPSNIQPPCVLVEPAAGSFNYLGAGCNATHGFNLLVILPGVRVVDSLPVADELITKMLEAGVPLSEWTAASVPMGESSSLPAFRFPVEIAAPWSQT